MARAGAAANARNKHARGAAGRSKQSAKFARSSKKTLLKLNSFPTARKLDKQDGFESASEDEDEDGNDNTGHMNFDSDDDDSNSDSDSDSEEEEEEEEEEQKKLTKNGEEDPRSPLYWRKRAKQRVLTCMSRGMPNRPRHLMQDIIGLLPHSCKESKLDDKKSLRTLNELADLHSCGKVVYLESRRGGDDLYLWISSSPSGPSAKLHVLNEHTKEELRLTGNHLRGSRTLLSFDPAFDAAPHWQVLKELLAQIFNVPNRHRRSKPFFDHILQFAILDDKIWVRNYQIVCGPDDPRKRQRVPALETNSKASNEAHVNTAKDVAAAIAHSDDVTVNEVGPRFVMDPVKIFRGSFGGESLWSNSTYVTPGEQRRLANQSARLASEDRRRNGINNKRQ